jgi:hypothetical protein
MSTRQKLIVIFLVVIFALGVSILAYAQNPEAAKLQSHKKKCLLKRGKQS